MSDSQPFAWTGWSTSGTIAGRSWNGWSGEIDQDEWLTIICETDAQSIRAKRHLSRSTRDRCRLTVETLSVSVILEIAFIDLPALEFVDTRVVLITISLSTHFHNSVIENLDQFFKIRLWETILLSRTSELWDKETTHNLV